MKKRRYPKTYEFLGNTYTLHFESIYRKGSNRNREDYEREAFRMHGRYAEEYDKDKVYIWEDGFDRDVIRKTEERIALAKTKWKEHGK